MRPRRVCSVVRRWTHSKVRESKVPTTHLVRDSFQGNRCDAKWYTTHSKRLCIPFCKSRIQGTTHSSWAQWHSPPHPSAFFFASPCPCPCPRPCPRKWYRVRAGTMDPCARIKQIFDNAASVCGDCLACAKWIDADAGKLLGTKPEHDSLPTSTIRTLCLRSVHRITIIRHCSSYSFSSSIVRHANNARRLSKVVSLSFLYEACYMRPRA